MNTASRMESTGIPGRIHVSSETAKELAKLGCQDWLMERQDKQNIKGKGMMTTFWVDVTGDKNSTSIPVSDDDIMDHANVVERCPPDDESLEEFQPIQDPHDFDRLREIAECGGHQVHEGGIATVVEV